MKKPNFSGVIKVVFIFNFGLYSHLPLRRNLRPLLFSYILISLFVLPIAGCKSTRHSANKNDEENLLNAVNFGVVPTAPEYHASRSLDWDLIHMSLNILPLWKSMQVEGKAILQLHPHFFEQDTIKLDAKCMQIGNVHVGGKKESMTIRPFFYQSDSILLIPLGKKYVKTDTLWVEINYTAKPEECSTGGSEAITSEKGFFFINAHETDPYKPRQFWTQGETSYNSRWFPTIEAPNQRLTHDITITVEDAFLTLSNGVLAKSVRNQDGTRSDRWEMNQPHPVYLIMVAGGNFKKVSDTWNEKEVSYYVEPAYESSARAIFGHTPEMIEYFSNLLDYPYPWNKYAQIVVRDYVSGAMENTTATVIGESIQKTKKELPDDPQEEIISHELFHQWFGDLVTCESWANLPLNESFATYGEYLWIEHKYGLSDAEEHRFMDRSVYFFETMQKVEPLFRPYYSAEEDMFDAHSYQKGGLVLNYLRKISGDEAFFASVRHYLKTRAFQSAEIDHLRQSFEEVTGQDWRWFFDQWFYYPGHPQLSVVYSWSEETKTIDVTIDQVQNEDQTYVYKLPTEIVIGYANNYTIQPVLLKSIREVLTFPCSAKPLYVTVDPQSLIPGVVIRDSSYAVNAAIYNSFKEFGAKFNAIEACSVNENKEGVRRLMVRAMQEPMPGVRSKALEKLEELGFDEDKTITATALKKMIVKDSKASNRSRALSLLNEHFKGDEELWQTNLTALDDGSYLVQSEALTGLNSLDPELGMKRAKSFEADSNIYIVRSVAEVYSHADGEQVESFFLKNTKRTPGFFKYDILRLYGNYLIGKSDSIINRGIPIFEETARTNTIWYLRLHAINELGNLVEFYESKKSELELKLNKSSAGTTDKQIQEEIRKATAQRDRIFAIREDIISKEEDPNLILLFKGHGIRY